MFISAKEITSGEWQHLDMVRTILCRMDQDPAWPPWIPVNQH